MSVTHKMTLHPFPSAEALRERLRKARYRTETLGKAHASKSARESLGHAIDDLNDAADLLGQAGVDEKPHILRVVDTFIDVAEWRMRRLEALRR